MHDGRPVEIGGEALHVKRRRADDYLQIVALTEQLFGVAQQEVDIE